MSCLLHAVITNYQFKGEGSKERVGIEGCGKMPRPMEDVSTFFN